MVCVLVFIQVVRLILSTNLTDHFTFIKAYNIMLGTETELQRADLVQHALADNPGMDLGQN